MATKRPATATKQESESKPRKPTRTRLGYLKRWRDLPAGRREDFDDKVFDALKPMLVRYASIHVPDGNTVDEMIETAGRESAITAYVDFVQAHPREVPFTEGKRGRVTLHPRLKAMAASRWRKRSVDAAEELHRAFVRPLAEGDVLKVILDTDDRRRKTPLRPRDARANNRIEFPANANVAKILAHTRESAGSYEAYETALRSIPDGLDALLVQYVDMTMDQPNVIAREFRDFGRSRLREVWGSDMREPSTLDGLRMGYGLIEQAETVARVLSQEDHLWNLVLWFAVDWAFESPPLQPDEVGPRLIRGASAVVALCRDLPMDGAVGPLGSKKPVRIAHADEVEAYAKASIPESRKGRRDRGVLGAIAQVAREDGNGRMTARSLRELAADLAKMDNRALVGASSKDTVVRRIPHLEDRGLVWVIPHLRGKSPPILVLTLPDLERGPERP